MGLAIASPQGKREMKQYQVPMHCNVIDGQKEYISAMYTCMSFVRTPYRAFLGFMDGQCQTSIYGYIRVKKCSFGVKGLI